MFSRVASQMLTSVMTAAMNSNQFISADEASKVEVQEHDGVSRGLRIVVRRASSLVAAEVAIAVAIRIDTIGVQQIVRLKTHAHPRRHAVRDARIEERVR